MLEFLRGGGSSRKLRLFACACCRTVWHLLADGRYRDAVGAAELAADGASVPDVARVERRAFEAVREYDASDEYRQSQARRDGWVGYLGCVYRAAAYAVGPDDGSGLDLMTSYGADAAPSDSAPLLRDIFGNPFRPVAFDPAWRSPTAVALAARMYESRDFGGLPVLADALQDAGCEHPGVLHHCRGGGEHVRGCWVVDLVLGKA
jgi:hypothetical protein